MYTLDMIRSRRDDIHAITARYQVTNIRIFGSVARGSQDENSDIDILVHPGPDFSLFTHSDLIHDLQDLLGVQVHVVSDRGLRPRVLEQVVREAVPL
ncbi:nucleotidyltransferase family protein [uncultured Methanospirillum sp.]|uniref:nucleotidyltransferase family protein n=1 Tax=uncultured Methanospirillum sp. TaxID=262503 RepID=UPI0029C8EA15|nr:nucleotidyltransferase family protein [uncultured Methanospirillum sp.]